MAWQYYLRIGTGVPGGDVIFSKLDHLGSSHVHTARTATNLNSKIDKNQIINSSVDQVSHLRRVLGKRSVMWSLESRHTWLLLDTRILSTEELPGLLLALGEVGQVPVSHSGRQGGVHSLLVFPCKCDG